MKAPCLIIIDVQEKLFSVIPEKDKLLENLSILIKGFQLFKLPILLSEQVPEKLGSTIKPIKSLLSKNSPIIKSSFSCASEPGFLHETNALTSFDGFVLAGIETHICVYQTERDLIHRGHHVEVVADAVASRKKKNKKIALDRIRNNGGFLTTTEMILFTIQGTSESPSFRELSRLVK